MAGKREAEKPRSKKDLVVDAARKLFLEEGFGTTSMDAVAGEAGVSKATIYSYFKSKDLLFCEMMNEMCHRVGDDGLEPLPDGPPEKVLAAVGRFFLDRLLLSIEERILPRVIAEAAQFPELGRTAWRTGPENVRRAVEEYLAGQDRRGVLDVKDPGGAASLFVGLVAGPYALPLLLGIGKRPTKSEIERDLEQIVKGFVSTLRSR